MTQRTPSGCTIEYRPDAVIVSGPRNAREHEARRILSQFASSGRPLHIVEHDAKQLVLRAST